MLSVAERVIGGGAGDSSGMYCEADAKVMSANNHP